MRSLHSWIVRRLTYPAWQWRHGGRVLSTLASLEESQWVNPGDLEALQVAKLGALLRHAQARSPYYREVFRRAGFDPREVRSLVQLRDLPVLEKADLRDRVAEIMTTAFGRGLVKRKTSGSTGIPLVLWAEPEARDAWTAAGLRFLRWWGIEIGDRRATLISRHALTPGTRLKQFLLANTLEYSAMDLSAATLPGCTRGCAAACRRCSAIPPRWPTWPSTSLRSTPGCRRRCGRSSRRARCCTPISGR